ncbi:hypothetical protein WJ75_19210 [Burkholderia ubonensis]|nr:hypothetical protein WJ75_19210 [Burkholderia ubonensis]
MSTARRIARRVLAVAGGPPAGSRRTQPLRSWTHGLPGIDAGQAVSFAARRDARVGQSSGGRVQKNAWMPVCARPRISA